MTRLLTEFQNITRTIYPLLNCTRVRMITDTNIHSYTEVKPQYENYASITKRTIFVN